MRSYLAKSLFLLLLALPAHAVEPLQLYGAEALYTVERKGKSIGQYRLSFQSQAKGGFDVDVAMQLQISVLGLFHYDYRYRAREQWESGRLAAMQVYIDDDGDTREYRFNRRADGLYRLNNNAGDERLGDNLLTSNHWHPLLMKQTQLLNTLTGNVSQLKVELQGEDELQVGERTVSARRYRLGGDLENTLSWYDERGRWLGMEFSARDGSRIRVRLQSSTEMNTREES
ncbi:MAG: hypothetical protein GYB41_11935 [Oceanospirillales bacterium]|nr:hypothetical protein [Oceanospirillales bacterium]